MTLDCCQSNQAGITRRDFAAVFREVTQRSRDIPKNGCERGYPYLGTFVRWYSTPQREKNQLSTATLQQNLKFGINIMFFFFLYGKNRQDLLLTYITLLLMSCEICLLHKSQSVATLSTVGTPGRVLSMH